MDQTSLFKNVESCHWTNKRGVWNEVPVQGQNNGGCMGLSPHKPATIVETRLK